MSVSDNEPHYIIISKLREKLMFLITMMDSTITITETASMKTAER